MNIGMTRILNIGYLINDFIKNSIFDLFNYFDRLKALAFVPILHWKDAYENLKNERP